MDIKRIRYVSQISPSVTTEDIQNLVTTSANNNAMRGITGVLMANGGLFYQVLEGPADSLDALYSRILVDRRHEQVLLLAEESQLEERFFGSWSMRLLWEDSETSSKLDGVPDALGAILEQQRLLALATRELERKVRGELHRLVRAGEAQFGLEDGIVREIA